MSSRKPSIDVAQLRSTHGRTDGAVGGLEGDHGFVEGGILEEADIGLTVLS